MKRPPIEVFERLLLVVLLIAGIFLGFAFVEHARRLPSSSEVRR